MAPSAFEDIFNDDDESKRGAPTGSAFEQLFADDEPAIDSQPKGSITEDDLVDAFNTGDYSTIDAKYAAGDQPAPTGVVGAEDADSQAGGVFAASPEEGPAYVDPAARETTPNVAAKALKRSRDRADQKSTMTISDELALVGERAIKSPGAGVESGMSFFVRGLKMEDPATVVAQDRDLTSLPSGERKALIDKLQNMTPEGRTAYRKQAWVSKVLGLENKINEINEWIPDVPEKMSTGALGILDDALSGVGMFLPVMGVAAVTGGAPLVPAVGAFVTAFNTLGELEYQKYKELGYDDQTAFNAAKSSAAMQAVFESAGGIFELGQIGKMFQGTGFGSLLGRVGKMMAAEGFEEISQQQVAAVADVWAKNGAPDQVDENMLSKMVGDLKDTFTSSEHWRETGYAGVTGAVGGGVMGGGPAAAAYTKSKLTGRSDAGTQVTDADGPVEVTSEDGVTVVTPKTEDTTPTSKAPSAARREVDQVLGVASESPASTADKGVSTSSDGMMTEDQAAEALSNKVSTEANLAQEGLGYRAEKLETQIQAMDQRHTELEAFWDKAMEEGDTAGAADLGMQIVESAKAITDANIQLVETAQNSMKHHDAELPADIITNMQADTQDLMNRAQTMATTASNANNIVKAEARQAFIDKLETEEGLKDELIAGQVTATNGGDTKLAKLNERVLTEMNTKEVALSEAQYLETTTLKQLNKLRQDLGARIHEDRIGPQLITPEERRQMKTEQNLNDEQIDALNPTPKELDARAQVVAAKQWVDEQILNKQEFDLEAEERDIRAEAIKAQDAVGRPKTVDRPAVKTIKEPKGPIKPVSADATKNVAVRERKLSQLRLAKSRARTAQSVKDARAKSEAIRKQKQAVAKPKVAPSKEAQARRAQTDMTKAERIKHAAAIRKQQEENKDLAQQASAELDTVRAAVGKSTGRIRVDALGEEGTTTPPDKAQVTITDKKSPAHGTTFTIPKKATPEQTRGAVTGKELDFTKGEAKVDVLKNEDATYGIVTAENPQGQTTDDKVNVEKNKALLAKLKDMGYKPVQIKGQFGNLENPYLIPGISQKEIEQIGIEVNQESVIHVDRGVAKYIEGNKVMEGVKTSDIRLTPDADDFYSEIDGVKFVIPFFEDKGIDLVGHNKEMSKKYDINLDLSAPTLSKTMGTVEIVDALQKRMLDGKYDWLYKMAKGAKINIQFITGLGQIESNQDVIRTYSNLKNRENFVKRFEGDMMINPRTGNMEQRGGVFGMYLREPNTAFINIVNIGKRAKDLAKAEETIVHEVLHGIVQDRLNRMTMPQKKALNDDLKTIWNSIDQDFIRETRDNPATHPTIREGIKQVENDSIAELVTYSFAHPAFADWLSAIPASEKFQALSKMKKRVKSIWDALTDLITRKVLKVPSRHDELVDLLSREIAPEMMFSKEMALATEAASKDSDYATKWHKDMGYTWDTNPNYGVNRYDFSTRAANVGVDLHLEEMKDGLMIHMLKIPSGKSSAAVGILRSIAQESRRLNKPVNAQIVNDKLAESIKKRGLKTQYDRKTFTTTVRFSQESDLMMLTDFDFGANVTPDTIKGWLTEMDAPGAAETVIVKDAAELEEVFDITVPDNVSSLWIDEDKGKKPSRSKGINYPGRPRIPQHVVFIADRIQSEEHFVMKFLHEQAGHAGLRNVFGENKALFARFLDQAYNLLAINEKEHLDNIIELYDIGNVQKDGSRRLTQGEKRVAAEEVLARRLETMKPITKKSLLIRFRNFLKRWLPKKFVARVNEFKMKDEDLWTILQAARESVMVEKSELGARLAKALGDRRGTFAVKGMKTMPKFMESDKTYKQWAKDVAKAVPEAKAWYKQHVELMKEHFGPDADLMSALLAMTSPQADVDTNVMFAVQSYLYAMNLMDKPGHRFPKKFQEDVMDKWTDAKSMLATLESKNFKVTEFLRALMGDSNATVGDIWMYRAFFGDHAANQQMDENPRVTMQTALRHKLHTLAAQLTDETGESWSPRDLQAAIWVYVNAKTTGKSFEKIASFKSGFNKPTPVFDGLTPLEKVSKEVPNHRKGPLSQQLGIETIEQAPVSTLEKKLTLQIEKAKQVKPYDVDESGAIKLRKHAKGVQAIADMIQTIADGGRSLTAANEDMAKWYKQVFGFTAVDGLDMQLSDQALDLYTNPKGIVKTNLVRDNLGGFLLTNFSPMVRFSREARQSLEQIAEMSTVDQDAEFIKTGNDGTSVTGKIHEWRDQSALNINRLTDRLEQDFLKTFGGRSAKTAVRFLGVASGKMMNTGNTELLQKAMNLYIDSGTGANRDKALEYAKELVAKGKKLTNAEKIRLATIERMLGLTQEEQAWADENIRPFYEEFFNFAQEHNIIDSHVDNYVKRMWIMPKEYKDSQVVWNGGSTAGFKVTTDSGKQRSLDSIVDGWKAGMELKSEGVINNLSEYANEIGYVFANRRFVDYMKSLITFEAEGLMDEVTKGDRVPQGYKQITERGFARPGFQLVARADIADEINKLGERPTHKLWDIPMLRGIRRINAMIKSTILSVSLYHHFAGMRSYVFGVKGKGLKLNPIKAYRRGLEKIDKQEGFTNPDYKHLGPVVDLLVREGLTLGKTQDWDEAALMESSLEEFLKRRKGRVAGKALDVWQVGRRFRRHMTTGLFGRLFAGLKAESAALEMGHHLKKLEKKARKEGRSVTDAEIKLEAQKVARLINADFGGLHLSRMGRNPDLQRLAQLTLLAPDWTESNWRTVTGMVPGLNKWVGKMMRDNPAPPGMGSVYRKFWKGIAIRGLMTVALTNTAILALFGDEEDVDDYFEMLKEQFTWKNYHKGKWLSVPIDPMLEKFGIETDPEKRRLLSVMGHFKDLLKLGDIRSLIKHKVAPVVRVGETVVSGTDWKGARFASMQEMFDEAAEGKLPALTAPHKYAEDLKGVEAASTLLPLIFYNVRQSIPIFGSEALTFAQGESSFISSIARAGGLEVRDTKRESIGQQKYDKLNREVNELNNNLKEARQLRDPVLIKEAREEIKAYPNFNRTKAQLGSTKSLLRPVNRGLKQLKLKQDAGKDLTPAEERRLQNLRERQHQIYNRFEQIVER